MGQLWNRIKKIAQSYSRDTPSWSYESIEEEDQQRLREIIDELNRQGPQHQGDARNNAGQTGNANRTNSENRTSSENRSNSGNQSGSGNQSRNRREAPGIQTPEAALAVLGLPAKATGEEIKRTYKKLMLKYHPDRVGTMSPGEQAAAHRRAQEINAAYQTLKVRYGL